MAEGKATSGQGLVFAGWHVANGIPEALVQDAVETILKPALAAGVVSRCRVDLYEPSTSGPSAFVWFGAQDGPAFRDVELAIRATLPDIAHVPGA